jgi:glucose/arabinose dehydrogenase
MTRRIRIEPRLKTFAHVRALSAGIAVALIVTALASIVGSGQTSNPAQAPAVAPIADLQLPAGFRISVFASDLPGARLMTVSPEGTLLVARRRTHEVVALPDQNKDGVAEPSVILSGLTNAHSLAFKDGYLYIATTPAVMRVRWADGRPVGKPEEFAELPSSTPSVHTSRTIRVGKDGRLYVSIGSSCNVCVEPDPRRTTIQVFDGNGSHLQPYAVGLRNAIGFDWDPQTGRLWAADTGQDGSGDDFPPDEINLVEAGKHYGFPFFVGRNLANQAPELKDVQPAVTAAQAVPPAFALPAHVTGIDLRFYTGTQFPAQYRNALFLSLHGSTTIPEKVGYKVVRIVMKDGSPVGLEDFVTGWLKGGIVSGRPAGLATGADGALYVSDDNKGFIYRITYGEK